MSIDHPSKSKSPSIDRSFVESVDCFLQELADLRAQGIGYQKFYELVIQQLKILTTAESVSVLVAGADGEFEAAISESDATAVTPKINHLHFKQADESGRAQIISNGAHWMLIARIERNSEYSKAIVGTWSIEDRPDQMFKVFGDLFDAVAEVAGDFERRCLIDNQDERFRRLESFVQLLHNSTLSLELEPFGFQVTNDSRAFLDADRVWLYANQGNAKLIASSSVDSVNLRSDTVKAVSRIAGKALTDNQSFSGGLSEADASRGHLRNYLEESAINGLYLRLLKDSNERTIGVLIVEFHRPHDRVVAMDGINHLLPTIQSTFKNAYSYSQIPFRKKLARLAGGFSVSRLGHHVRTMIVLGVAAIAIAAIFFIKSDFEIDVAGQLRPVHERHLFAPADAMVEELHVQYGDEIKSDSPVISLVSKELDFQLNEIQNELLAAGKKLQAVKLLRAQAAKDNRDSVYLAQLVAEMEQVELEIESLQRKIDWFNRKQDELRIMAPIDGKVITRDLELKLQKRPVKKGDVLMSIADTRSDWQIEFDVPDRDFGYLLESKRNDFVDQWMVQYRFKSELSATHESIVDSFDQTNTIDREGNSLVRITLPVDIRQLEQPRVGQTVDGRIYLGRRSLFFIWTRDVRDFIRANFFWM